MRHVEQWYVGARLLADAFLAYEEGLTSEQLYLSLVSRNVRMNIAREVTSLLSISTNDWIDLRPLMIY